MAGVNEEEKAVEKRVENEEIGLVTEKEEEEEKAVVSISDYLFI